MKHQKNACIYGSTVSQSYTTEKMIIVFSYFPGTASTTTSKQRLVAVDLPQNMLSTTHASDFQDVKSGINDEFYFHYKYRLLLLNCILLF